MKKNTEDKSSSETLRQRAEELLIVNKELTLKQDNLRKIASRVPGVVYQYLLRPDGTSCFPYASKAIREIFRVSPDEVREDSSKVFANGHPDDLPGVYASIRESAQNLTPWQHEFRVKFDDGTIRSLYGNAVPQKEEDGSVLWHGFITDITGRKQAEKKSETNAALLTNLILNLKEGVLLEDSTRKILLTNQLFCEMFGIPASPEALLGADSSNAGEESKAFFKDPDKFIADINVILADKKTVLNNELELLDGRFFERDYIPTYFNHEYSGHLWRYRDITARKRVEFDIKKKNDESIEQQALFTSALDAIADVILYHENSEDILVNANRILGETLQLDRSVIYQVSFEKNQITGLCEWLQTTFPEITATIGNYPFDWFRCPLSELKNNQNFLVSQFNAVNEHFIEDGSGIKLHQGMKIKSLLWYPFDFDEHRFYVFTLNQVLEQKQWTPEDISFISSVAKQVSVALLKIRLLNERKLVKESEEKLRTIIETSPDGIAITSLDGTIQFVTAKAVSMWGYDSVDELIGRNTMEFVHSSYHEKAIFLITEMLKGNLTGAAEYLMVRKNRSTFYAEANASVLCDANNNPIGILYVERDITEQKKAEEEKQKTDSKIITLSMAIKQSPVTIVITDLAGNIEFVNPKFTQTTGYTAEEAIGNNPRILKAGEKSDLEYRELWEMILGGQTWSGVFQNKKKNGELYWESAVISPVKDNDGTITHFLAVKEDITERMKSEAALKKAKDDAEAATKSKSTFLANMSHEIRTPLNAIIGFSQLMNREKLLSDTHKEYVTSINRAGEHLLKLINDILELSKIEAGRVELNLVNFDLQTVLNDLPMMFKEQAQSKQLKLFVEANEDLPHHIIADEHKLRQILINLTGNAIKFTDFGSIVIRAKVVKGRPDFSRLIVEIQDSGPGMSEEELGKLFKRFEQTTAGINSTRGTGLGLALSRELALLMGGNITVTSEKGKGSVFTVNVEIREGESEVREVSITKRVTGIDNPKDAYRVLLVDDKKENRQVMGSFLRLAGFETEEAVDGKDAIAKFEQWNPHLILMDMRMPVMDGYEATRHIKSTEKGKLTPVIAVTASSLEDEKINVLQLDIQGYIPKPFHESELFETIGRVLGINYIYEEETTAGAHSEYPGNDEIINEDIGKLPENLVLQMKNAVVTADFHLLTKYIRNIENDYPELCRHLMTQANDFNYVYLLQVLSTRGK